MKEQPALHASEITIPAISLASQTRGSRMRQISEVRDSPVGKRDCPDRVNEFWRDIRPVEWPIVIRPSVAGRRLVTQVNPRFGGLIMDACWELLIGCAPGEPYCIHRHAGTNLSLADQCLIVRREALIHLRMLRNPPSCRSATTEHQCPGHYRECQRDPRYSTLHAL